MLAKKTGPESSRPRLTVTTDASRRLSRPSARPTGAAARSSGPLRLGPSLSDGFRSRKSRPFSISTALAAFLLDISTKPNPAGAR
jgi:hypothetical protein